jgi:hypothetical protein
MSTQFQNYSISEVNFVESAGNDLGNSGSHFLLVIPDTGYTVDVNNFTVPNIPAEITNYSLNQDGLNLRFNFDFTNGTIMPSNDIDFSLCIQGFAVEEQFTVQGSVDITTTNSVPLPQIIPYSESGSFGSSKTVFTQTITADAGYYFPTVPTASLVIGSLSNYSISQSIGVDPNDNMTAITFTVDYEFPNYSVTGDSIVITADAEELYNPTIEIQSYSISSSYLLISGETRPITIYGIAGAAWQLEVIESVGGTTIGQFSGTIDSTGSAAEDIIFPASLVDVDYTFVLTGDLSSTFCTSFPYTPCLTGQPSVWQLHQYAQQQVSFALTTTNPNITVSASDDKFFSPDSSPGFRSYSVSASKSASSSDFIFDTTPVASNWSNQGLGIPQTDQVVQAPLSITVDNASDPKTLVIDLETNIYKVGTQSLLSELNLDDFLLSYTELTLCYALTEADLCCGTSESRTVFVSGDVANLASVTGDLYTDATLQTKAADGYYSDDAGISCTPSSLTAFNTSVGNTTDNCSSTQVTPLYFQVVPPATNQSPLIGDAVFSDQNGTILNNTTTTMYYISSLTAYGVNQGLVVSIAPCTTPPPGREYLLQNGGQSDAYYSYTSPSGALVSSLLGGFESVDYLCAKLTQVSADTNISVNRGPAC